MKSDQFFQAPVVWLTLLYSNKLIYIFFEQIYVFENKALTLLESQWSSQALNLLWISFFAFTAFDFYLNNNQILPTSIISTKCRIFCNNLPLHFLHTLLPVGICMKHKKIDSFLTSLVCPPTCSYSRILQELLHLRVFYRGCNKVQQIRPNQSVSTQK